MKSDKGVLGQLLSVEPPLVCQNVEHGIAVVRAFVSAAGVSSNKRIFRAGIAHASILLAVHSMQELSLCGAVDAETKKWAEGAAGEMKLLAKALQDRLRAKR